MEQLELHKLTLPHLTERWSVHSCDVLSPFQPCEISLYSQASVCMEEDTEWPLELIFSDEEPEVCRNTHAQSTWVSLLVSVRWKRTHEDASLAFQQWTAPVLSFLQSLKNLEEQTRRKKKRLVESHQINHLYIYIQ